MAFIKHTGRTVNGKQYRYKHLVESYRDEDGVTRHNYLLNLSKLPQEIVKIIEDGLDDDKITVNLEDVLPHIGDPLRGAGQLAIWRAWEKANFDQVLSRLTEKQRQSTKALAFSRITDPCSKLAIKERMADTFLSPIFSCFPS